MTKTLFITDLKSLQPNDRFETILLVKSKETRKKKNGVPFLSLTLSDRSGSIDSKIWDNVEELSKTFQANDFILARGKVQVFNNQHQAIVTWLRKVAEDHVRLADFVPHTAFDIESMYDEVLETIDGFSNPHLKSLLGSIFRDPEFARLYNRTPAARANHHAKIGGLLEHVLSLLRLSKLVASHYADIDGELLACGVLLHDAGKVFELSSERSFEYTNNGKLLGHIPMGTSWLGQRCDEIAGFPSHLKTLLLHLVLSHHGKLEFGSPQVPLFPEALALHFLDDLDAKLEMMREAKAGIVDGSVWSPFHHALGRSVLDTTAYLRSEPPLESNLTDASGVAGMGQLQHQPVEEPVRAEESGSSTPTLEAPEAQETADSTLAVPSTESGETTRDASGPLAEESAEEAPPSREAPPEGQSAPSVSEASDSALAEPDSDGEPERTGEPRPVMRPKPARQFKRCRLPLWFSRLRALRYRCSRLWMDWSQIRRKSPVRLCAVRTSERGDKP